MGSGPRVAVLGGGLWGTALAAHLARVGRSRVSVWEFFPDLARTLARTRRHPGLPGLRLPGSIQIGSDLAAAAAGADVLLSVVASTVVRQTARALKRAGARAGAVVNASKGIEPGTLLTMGEVLGSELGTRALYTLSGPSFAREVARGVPTRLVLAGPSGPAARAIAALFDSGCLRVSLSGDRKGVELGGSLKNALAVGCGVLDGLKAGANTQAALLVQGMAEMAALIEGAGGRRETIYGPAGLGDLVLTGTSSESRNRSFGELLGRGLSPAAARRRIPTVVEGADALVSARALARRLKVRVPLLEAVHGVVHRGRDPQIVLAAMGFSVYT